MQNPNFLILDEPTNDLDIATLEVLEDYLRDFAGCVLIVSHDRYFLDELVDHVFAFDGTGGVKDYPGNYSQYFEWLSSKEYEPEKSTKKIKPQKTNKTPKKKLSYKERLEFEKLEKEIDKLNSEKRVLENKLNNEQLAPEEMVEISNSIGELINQIEEKEYRWLELDEMQIN